MIPRNGGQRQLAVNLAILAMAFVLWPPAHAALSAVGTAVINLVIAINHKPGRYLGVT